MFNWECFIVALTFTLAPLFPWICEKRANTFKCFPNSNTSRTLTFNVRFSVSLAFHQHSFQLGKGIQKVLRVIKVRNLHEIALACSFLGNVAKTAREDNLALKKNSYFAWEGEAGGGEETLIGM